MDFSGWEKLSLLDFDDNITTTLFMAGCDFRCPFCHNSSLVLDPKGAPTIPWDEILEYLRQRKNVLDAVCVTGGEPTLMPDLLEKLTQIKQLGYIIKLDSNGSRPEVLRIAVEQGLVDYVAMDIKNSKEKYAMTIGTTAFKMEDIEESVRFLIDGRIPYEFRTTSILEYHNQKDFEEIGKWLAGAKKYYIQRYIDSENCISHGLHMIPKEQALIYKDILSKTIDHVDLRGYD
jgi:pyruvate formate lyase activating enzyme